MDSFVFYNLEIENNPYDICYRFLYGKKAEEEGYYYPSIDMNLFATEPVKIPKNAKKVKRPSKKWIKNFMYDKNKTHTVKKEINESGTVYRIHHNGGTPFVYYISQGITVYRPPVKGYIWSSEWSDDYSENLGFYSEICYYCKQPQLLFLGKDPSFLGNSVLVKEGVNRYVYIGSEIYRFYIKDQIVDYFSLVGPNDVPYPVAVSSDNVFYMLDKVYIAKKDLQSDDYLDGYTEFYNLSPDIKKTPFPFEIIVKRN